jgi:hypothetical protein
MTPVDAVGSRVSMHGFALVPGIEMQRMLSALTDESWTAFAASWEDLAVDGYLLERGIRRRRRHAVFSVTASGRLVREPHQPHYQSRQYNALQGGIERWFEPILPAVAASAVLSSILECCAQVFGSLGRAGAWRVEVHQFRIEASGGELGRPTPEGIHRDGVDYVLVLLVARTNVGSGTTEIYGVDGERLGSFTLQRAFDSMFVDDARVAHGVTPIRAVVATLPAHRDVLVVTFARSTGPS